MLTASFGSLGLDISEDFSFELVLQSQLWDFDKLKSGYVPSLSFPDTENNRAVFNHPNRFEIRHDGVKEYPGFELRSDGYLLVRGTLALNDGFSGSVYGAVGELKTSQYDKLITDNDLPEDQEFESKTSYSPDEDDYCAPTIFNRNFFKDLSKKTTYTGGLEQTLFQHYHGNAEYMVNPKVLDEIILPTDDIDLTYKGTGKLIVISPMMYLFNTINMLLRANRFFLSANDFSENAELMQLCIYNNYSIVKYGPKEGSEKYVYGQNPYGEWEGGQGMIMITMFEQQTNTFNYSHLLPKITLGKLLLDVQNLINCVFVFDDNNKVSIVDRETRITGAANDIDEYFAGTWIMGKKEKRTIRFTIDHDNGDEQFAEQYQDLTQREDDFEDDVASLVQLAAIDPINVGELRRVLVKQAIYETRIAEESIWGSDCMDVLGWFFASIDFQPVKYNPGYDIFDIKTGASTAAYRYTANVKQMGRCNLRRDTEKGFSLRLLFNELGRGTNTSTNYVLRFEGEKNLLLKRWKHTARFLSTMQPAEAYFNFPVNILSTLDLNKKQSTRHGHFFINKLVTRFTNSGPGLSKAECYKLE